VSFFICQSHLAQHDVDGLQGAPQSGRLPQFLQSQVVLLGQQTPHLILVGADNHRLAPAEPVSGSDVAGVSARLQEFLDHAQGNAETVGDLGPRAFLMVIGSQNSFPKIQR